MCTAIKEFYDRTGVQVGLKPAGGINTVMDAVIFYTITKKFSARSGSPTIGSVLVPVVSPICCSATLKAKRLSSSKPSLKQYENPDFNVKIRIFYFLNSIEQHLLYIYI